MPAKPKEKRANLLRATGFVMFLIMILYGPFSKQVLHSDNFLLREWRMFADVGVGLMDVTFYRVDDGNLKVLNRFETLGYKNKKDVPEWLWIIDSEEDLELVVDALCEKLGDSTDLRLEGRVGTHDGWQDLDFPDQNLCKEFKNDTD